MRQNFADELHQNVNIYNTFLEFLQFLHFLCSNHHEDILQWLLMIAFTANTERLQGIVMNKESYLQQ